MPAMAALCTEQREQEHAGGEQGEAPQEHFPRPGGPRRDRPLGPLARVERASNASLRNMPPV